MLLTVLGSNGTYPSPGNPGSGYLVTTDSTSVLLDLGPGVFTALMERGVACDGVVITHAHADHCLDLFSLFNRIRFDDRPAWGLPVLAPQSVFDRVATFLGAGPDHDLFSVFDCRPVEPGDRLTLGEATLEFGAAAHSVPAVVVSVAADGGRLVYSGDTGPGGDLVSLAAECDLLLCEATHQGSPGADRDPHHLHAVEAGLTAMAAKAGRLLVTHVAPSLDPAVSVAEAGSVFEGAVDHAAPGLEVEV